MDWLTERDRLPMQHPVEGVEEEVEVDTYFEPWVAWRSWNLKLIDDKIRLESITYRVIWEPESEICAKCINVGWNKMNQNHKDLGKHTTPNKNCGCGIYAVTDINGAKRWGDFPTSYGTGIAGYTRCYGEVKLWGIVYRYTRGFLAQKAYPKSLLIPHDLPTSFPLEPQEVVKELRRTYRGVEVNLL